MRINLIFTVAVALAVPGAAGISLAAPSTLPGVKTLIAEDSDFHLAQMSPNGRGGSGGRRSGGGGLSIGLGIAIPLIVDQLNQPPRRQPPSDRPSTRNPERADTPRPRRPRGQTAGKPPATGGSRQTVSRTPPPREPAISQPQPAPVPPVASDATHRDREILILVSDTAGDDVRLAIMQAYNVQADPARRIGLLEAQLIKLRLADNRPLEPLVAQLSADPRVLSASLNYLYRLMDRKKKSATASSSSAAPVRAGAAQVPYNLAAIKAPEANQLAQGRNVPVAVIDTCIDASHADLQGAILKVFDATTGGNSAPCTAAESHGTGIAGIIAAHGTVTGVAPRSDILSVRAFTPVAPGRPAEAATDALVGGIDWAAQQNVRILNLSFAGPRDALLERLIRNAVGKGLLIVAAAGNAGPQSPPLYPAAYDGVIAVTALGPSRDVFAQANRGVHIGVAAPGVDILSLKSHGGYDVQSGTSLAAAHVSGILALMLEKRPDANARDLRLLLMGTAFDLGPKGNDDQFGAGLVNARDAVEGITPAPATAAVAGTR